MACDTFIKIAKSCRRHFVALQPSESEPFIEEIVRNLNKITCDLSPQQVHTFYEACGYMVAAQGNRNQQERLLNELMTIPNVAWDEIIKQATVDPSILQDADTIKIIGNIMKTNVSACSSIGSYFYPQIGRIYHDMLQMYRATSQLISEAVAREGTQVFCFFSLSFFLSCLPVFLSVISKLQVQVRPRRVANIGLQAKSQPRCQRSAACAPSRRRF
jgi:exportin-1